MIKFKFMFICITCFTTLILGQEKRAINSFSRTWFTFNSGISTTREGWDGALCFSFGLNITSPNNNIKFKYTNNLPGGLFSDSLQKLSSIGLLYGFKPNFEHGNVILSGGISVVSGYYHKSEYEISTGYTYEKISIYTIGFPFELQFNWNMFTKFGIGLSFFGDLNFERSFFGAGLNLNVGTLR